MGLLDDAIREHLELMRRRGADPDELARSEDEALGDPRNAEQAAVAASELDEPLEVPEFAAAPPEEPVEPPAAVASEPEGAPPEPPTPRDEAAWLEEEPEQQPAAAFAAPEVEPEVVAPDDEPASDADVLEETPDFLEETPEHDRLWFEQKPPRDFDFDN
jgi:hypothetical protein